MKNASVKLPAQRTNSDDDKVIDLVAAERQETSATSAPTVSVNLIPTAGHRRSTGHQPPLRSTHRLVDNGDMDLRWMRKVRHHQRHDTVSLRDRTTTLVQGITSDISDMVDDGMSWVEEVFGPPVAVDLP